MGSGWKDLKIDGIASIEKVVAEFIIGELNYTPYSKFKVKIVEKQKGGYIGYTNLFVKDDEGYPSPEVGIGDTIEEALKNTIEIFIEQLKKRKEDKGKLEEEDFEYADSFDF